MRSAYYAVVWLICVRYSGSLTSQNKVVPTLGLGICAFLHSRAHKTGSDEKTNEFALEQWPRQRETTVTAALCKLLLVKTRMISARALCLFFRSLMQEEEAVEYCDSSK